jgi:hypothetical protein
VAIQTSYNFFIAINGTTLSAYCTNLRVNVPQNANEAQAAGATHKQYRAGMGDPSIEATFRADDSTAGGPGYVLRPLVATSSTGFSVAARRVNAIVTSANPEYNGQFVVSGDLMAMEDEWGAVPSISVKLVPFGTFTISSTAT